MRQTFLTLVAWSISLSPAWAGEAKTLFSCVASAANENHDGALIQPSELSVDLVEARTRISRAMAQQDFRFKKARHKPSVLLQYVPEPASIQLSVAFDKKISNKFTLDPGASFTKTFPLPIPANVTYQQKFSDSSGTYPEIIFSCGLKEARTEKSIQPDRADCAKP